MGEVLFAGKEAQKWPALLGDMITDCTAQHGIAILKRVEECALRSLTLDLELDLAADLRQRSQMLREYDSDHARVSVPVCIISV
jgi:hypothetical protein